MKSIVTEPSRRTPSETIINNCPITVTIISTREERLVVILPPTFPVMDFGRLNVLDFVFQLWMLHLTTFNMKLHIIHKLTEFSFIMTV